jgi:CRP/FNR family transcriptional regulator, cyclic AMP receptor protein
MTPAGLVLSHPLWDHLTSTATNELLEACEVRSYGAGQVVFRKGDPGDGLYGVLAGCVAVELAASSGRKLVLWRLAPGAFFGEVALLDGQGRTAEATARVASELLFLGRDAFRCVLARHPGVGQRLSEHLSGQVRRATEVIADLAFAKLPSRLAKQLLRSAEEHGRTLPTGIEVGLELPQVEIAAALGVSREIVDRQLARWRAAGLISLERRVIVIREPGRLRSIAASG